MGTITWVRPSGTEITTNDSEASIAYGKAAGWVNVNEPQPKAKKSTRKKADEPAQDADPAPEDSD